LSKKMALHDSKNATHMIDFLTGKVQREVFFDPAACTNIKDADEIWLTEHLYEPVFVMQDLGNELLVRTGEGDHEVLLRMDSKLVKDVLQQHKAGEQDILNLSDVTEESLLHTLRFRYRQNEVYTSVGPILISINPYKWNKEVYTEGVMLKYHDVDATKTRSSGEDRKASVPPPHLFQVADAAYVDLLNMGSQKAKSQAIVISGESGAGKTEATKIIMQFLTHISQQANTSTAFSGAEMYQLQERVLSTNPLLEAFGNAKTLRNDNSSRFGKYIQIQFNRCGVLCGAKITNYLLFY
jgi:myosin X